MKAKSEKIKIRKAAEEYKEGKITLSKAAQKKRPAPLGNGTIFGLPGLQIAILN